MTNGMTNGRRVTVFAGGSLVLRDRVVRADLTIDDSTIAAIGTAGAPGATPRASAAIVDCAGCDILPGFVDLHTDNLERHVEQRPGIFSSPARALLAHDAELASAGITTACDAITLGGGFPNDVRRGLAGRLVAALALARREGVLRVDHHLHLRCELSDVDLPSLVDTVFGTFGTCDAVPPGVVSPDVASPGVVSPGILSPRLVSLMNHTPGQRQWRDLEKFRRYYLRRYNLSDAELDALIVLRQANETTALPINRRIALDLAARTGARLVSHDDTDIRDVDEAAANGCAIAEFPTTAAAAGHAAARGLSVVGGGPNLVRGASHSGNISASELARLGHLHAIASDYSPSSLLEAVYLLRDRDGWPLAAAVRLATLGPAHAAALDDRGELAPGRRADVIVVSHTALGPVLRETWAAGRRVA
jgi:alpha-D-ribose 1-methylphosphonate 5-triphosphate diphosphatase